MCISPGDRYSVIYASRLYQPQLGIQNEGSAALSPECNKIIYCDHLIHDYTVNFLLLFYSYSKLLGLWHI